MVSPNTEQDVSLKLVRASLRTPKADWLLEPKTLAKGVHVGHVLLPNEGTHTAVWVANLTKRSFTLAAGAEVGQASTTRVLCTPNVAKSTLRGITGHSEA